MVKLLLIYGLLHGFASQGTNVQVQLKFLWRMFRTFKVCITLQSSASFWSLTDGVTAKSDSQTPWVYWQCSKGGGASLHWKMLTVNGPYCVPKSVVCALYHCKIGYLRNRMRHPKIERGLWFGLSLSLYDGKNRWIIGAKNRWFLGDLPMNQGFSFITTQPKCMSSASRSCPFGVERVRFHRRCGAQNGLVH